MSKTPRTDAQLKLEAFFDGIGIVETVEVEFAQQLETELAESRAEIENLKWCINSEKAKAEAALELNGKALELVNEARAENESLRFIVRNQRCCRNCDNHASWNFDTCGFGESPTAPEEGAALPQKRSETVEADGIPTRKRRKGRAIMIIIPDKLRRPAEVERDELRKQLAEAKAEIERLKSEHEDSLRRAKDNAVSLSGAVTEYAGELLVKDRLIEQMQEALEKCRDVFLQYAQIHWAKIPEFRPAIFPDPFAEIESKVERNQDMADLCAAALAAEREVRR